MTRRGRLLVTAVVLALAVALTAMTLGPIAAARTGHAAPIVYTVVTVKPGESLWEIATAATPDADPRAAIDRIVTLNQLSSAADVRVGQQLTVPTTPQG